MQLIFLIAVILFIISVMVFFNMALLRKGINPMGLGPKNGDSPWAKYAGVIKEGLQWFHEQKPEIVEIVSYDGLKLRAYYLPAEGSKTTVLLMHGYRSYDVFDFSGVYRHYHELGYDLLVPCQRSHGISEGKLICFGTKERFDCQRWVRYIVDTQGEDRDIIIEGMSMGATTVLMAAGLELPEQVKGVIADCGFTSPYEVMKATMRRWKLLPHPYLDLMCPVAKLFGIDLKLNTMDALKKCRIPVLLIHGTADDIVPHEMSVRNYEACAGKKELVLVEGAGHGCSYMVDKEKCEKALKDFLKENCRQRGD